MWIRFNKHGVLQEYLTHGNPARVGNTNFQIFAVFEDINIDEYFSNATIRFQRPDIQGSEYPNLFMQRVELTYEKLESDSDSTYFVNGHTYTGFLFNFNDFVANSEDRIILLDTPGMWEASITLLGANSELNVQGIIAFNVEPSVSMADDEAQVVDVAIIVSNIAQLLGNTIKKDDLYYEKVCEGFEEKATSGELSKNIFNVGSIVYDPTNNNVYKILTVTDTEDETKVSATYTLISTLNFVDLSLVTLPSDYSVLNLLNALNKIDDSNSGVYLVKFANDYATLIRTYHGYYTEFAIYGKENIYLANSVDVTNLNQFEVRKKLNDSDLSFVDLSSVSFPSEYLVSSFQSALNEAHSGEGVYLVKFSNNYAFVHRVSSGYAWNYTVYCRNKRYIGSSQDSTLNDFVLKSGDVAILTDVNGETTLAQLQTKLEGIGFANLGVISQTTGGTIDFTESLIQFEDYGGGGIGCFIVTPRRFFNFSAPAGNMKLKEAEQYGLGFYNLATKKELNDNLVVIELSDSVDTGTLSDSNYNLVANAKNCVILRNGVYYRKYNDYQGTINYQSGVSKTTATGKEALNWYGIAINKSTKVWTYTYHEGNYHYTVAGADGKFALISETGAELYIDTTDYKIYLRDKNHNNLSTIDLPLESVVVSGSYDSATKKVILTLQNGSTVEFSVADLVSGLQPIIDSNNKLNADLVDDTNSTHKFVTQQEKNDWDGKSDFDGYYDSLDNKPKARTIKYNRKWNSVAWNGLATFDGRYIWSDGSNIYYSNDSSQYVLNKKTNTWEAKTWNIDEFNGSEVWSDGNNIYCYASNYYGHRVLNTLTNEWEAVTWNGINFNLQKQYLWKDGDNIYCSYTYVRVNEQIYEHYILNKETRTWIPITWNGFDSFKGENVSNDARNVYCYISDTNKFYKLDRPTKTWSEINKLAPLNQYNVFNDGNDYYFGGGSGSNMISTNESNEWEICTDWEGLTSFNGIDVWKVGNHIYYSNGSSHYEMEQSADTLLDIETLSKLAQTGEFKDIRNVPAFALRNEVYTLLTNSLNTKVDKSRVGFLNFIVSENTQFPLALTDAQMEEVIKDICIITINTSSNEKSYIVHYLKAYRISVDNVGESTVKYYFYSLNSPIDNLIIVEKDRLANTQTWTLTTGPIIDSATDAQIDALFS